MFKRKLTALGFHNPEAFKVDDDNEFRNLIVWLEDQKIRHYKIEDRGPLRNIQASEWPEALNQYLSHVGCPVNKTQRTALLDWLLGYAIRLEYGDNVDKFRNVCSDTAQKAVKSVNPLDSIDFESADFKAGVASLAQLLQIPPHTDHQIILKAVCILVKERLSKEAVERAKKDGAKTVQTLPLEKVPLGFETGDYISAEAAKILRLLHVQDLRGLQTQINEAIVQCQALIANPKTDTRLGKVGR